MNDQATSNDKSEQPLKPLTGQTALVTGAALRTGRCIALALAAAGADLIIHYNHNQHAAAELASEIKTLGVKSWQMSADFSDPDAAQHLGEQVTEQVGKLDIIINNVGVYPVSGTLDLSVEQFQHTLACNLTSPYALIRSCLPLLQQSGHANIINIGYAGTELLAANSYASTYQISKTALLLLTKNLAQEFGASGIRANMVSPGQLDNSVDLPDDIEQVVPLGRAGKPQEIADMILFLLTKGLYISGINIDVAGGYKLGLAKNYQDQ
ncbi:MAG: SDR family oxidoreductase [Pseudomonadales bacterium]|nr:SDR family oxidoreductase [Pseudomonadales bacterium]